MEGGAYYKHNLTFHFSRRPL